MRTSKPVSAFIRPSPVKTAGWFAFLLVLLVIITVEVGVATGLGNALASALTGSRPIPSHLIAGFSIPTTTEAQQAKSEGVQTVLTYGSSYQDSTPLGHALNTTLHMTQIEGEPWELLHQFECHRLYTLRLPVGGYCSRDYPNMTMQSLLGGVENDMDQERWDPNVVGVWVLDDWPVSDPGSAAQFLPQIASVIHSYAPNLPTICGFGASLLTNGTGAYFSHLLDNFTPSGCDEVAFYIYSQPVKTTTKATFDWSMKSLLPTLLAGLKARGWNPKRTPLIGIVQAFGGERVNLPGYSYRTPTAADIAEQSESYCKAGASGLAFYAWYTSGLAKLLTPANDSDMGQGVSEGIAGCQQIWAGGKATAGTRQQTPTALRLREHDYISDQRSADMPKSKFDPTRAKFWQL